LYNYNAFSILTQKLWKLPRLRGWTYNVSCFSKKAEGVPTGSYSEDIGIPHPGVKSADVCGWPRPSTAKFGMSGAFVFILLALKFYRLISLSEYSHNEKQRNTV
jgi:hypothetical protein